MPADNLPIRCQISLRGSLADKYHHMVMEHGTSEGDAYIESLMYSTDQNLEKHTIGNQIVMGLESDKGLFLPEW